MIVVVGEALVDLVIDPAGDVTAARGGAPYNTARACGRLGADVEFVGAIANDRFGSMMMAQLEADHVGTSHVPRVDLPTTLAAAELDEGGTASYRFYIEGTSAPALTTVPALAGTEVLFTGGLGLVLQPMAGAVEAALAAERGDGAIAMVDVNCRPKIVPDRDEYVGRVRRVLRLADVVKVSDEDLAYLAPDVDPIEAARELLGLGASVVLVTAGGKTVNVLSQSGDATVAVPSVDVVDTIGAGDTFGAGFLAWWLASGLGGRELAALDRVVRAVEAATVAAGVACTRRGADPPWRHELPPDWSP